MQNTTGCKINVSPATGQDFEREIGLVGSRDSIERAKHAIMEKVHAVVCLVILFTFSDSHQSLTLSHSRRRTAAAVEAQIIKTNTTTAHPSRNPSSSISNRLITTRTRTKTRTKTTTKTTTRTRSSNSLAVLEEEEKRIPMQRTADIRTMSLCGILAIKPRIKASKTPKLKVPQARDVMTCVCDYRRCVTHTKMQKEQKAA